MKFSFLRTMLAFLMLSSGVVAQTQEQRSEAIGLLKSDAIYTADWFDYIDAIKNPHFPSDFGQVTFSVGGASVPAGLAEQLCEPRSFAEVQAVLQSANLTLKDALEDLGCYYKIVGFNARKDDGDVRIYEDVIPLFEGKTLVGPISLYQSWLAVEAPVAFDFAKDVARNRRYDWLNAALTENPSFIALPEFVTLINSNDFVRFVQLGQSFANFRSSSIFRANWALCRTIAGNLWREDPGKTPRSASALQSPQHVDHYNDTCVAKNWGWGLRGDMFEPLGPVLQAMTQASGTADNTEPFTKQAETQLLARVSRLVDDGASVNFDDDTVLPYLVDRPIDIAIRKRSVRLTQYLLDQGARTDHIDGQGFNPLSAAILAQFPIKVIAQVIENGADPSVRIPFDSHYKASGTHCTSLHERKFSVTVRYNALDFAHCHDSSDVMRLMVSLMDRDDINCNRLKLAQKLSAENGSGRDGLAALRRHLGDAELCK